MIEPRFLDQGQNIQKTLLNMHNNAKGKGVIENFKFNKWQVMDEEEMEFMTDLMDTLTM